MNRHDLLCYIRERILSDNNKTSNHQNYGVEKSVSKVRKRRISVQKMSCARSSFEDNVLRKAERIRSSLAYKQCCKRLDDYEDDEGKSGIVFKKSSYNYVAPLSNIQKNIFRIGKEEGRKRTKCGENRCFRAVTGGVDGWMYATIPAFAQQKMEKSKTVDVANGNVQNSRISTGFLQSEYLSTRNKSKDEKQVHPLAHSVKPNTSNILYTTNDSRFSTMNHLVNLDVTHGIDSSDEIKTQIKQSFNVMEELESNLDKAAQFLKASFSSRVSLSVANDDIIKVMESADEKPSHNERSFLKSPSGITRGVTLGCRLKAHIAYGRNVTEMGEHLRDVCDAVSNSTISAKHEEINDVKSSLSDERHFDSQSSFYTTVHQRLNEGLQHSSLSDDMYKPTQSLLKERNRDSFSSSDRSSFSKKRSLYSNGVAKKLQDQELEAQREQRAEYASIRNMNESSKNHSSAKTTSHTENDKLLNCASQKPLKREEYIDRTVKALRQFYKDSMLYFSELRKMYRQEKVGDLWKVKNEEERIKTACLRLKRKYIDSLHDSMSMKNFVDYHLHETARIQLLNLDIQKQLALFKGRRVDSNFEKLRRRSIKVIQSTNDYEKNKFASQMERWERKLQTRSFGNDSARSFASPVRVMGGAQQIEVRNLQSSKRLQQLRDDLKLKRREAEILKRKFDRRMICNDLSEEISLRAQIAAHERYIVESEKDIVRLISLENAADNRNGEMAVVAKSVGPVASNLEPSPSSSATTSAVSEETLSESKVSDAGKNITIVAAELDPEHKHWDPEGSCDLEELDHIHFSKDRTGQQAESISHRTNERFSPTVTHSGESLLGNCHFQSSCNSTSTASNFVAPLQYSETFFNCDKKSENRVTSDKTPLFKENQSAVNLQNTLEASESLAQLTIHSPVSNASNEIICNEPENFEQDASKEEVLIKNYIEQRDSLFSVVDEQFFTPLTSDAEVDNDGSSKSIQQNTNNQSESASSFHTTISSLIKDDEKTEKEVVQNLSPSSKPRKFRLTLSPLTSPKSSLSSRYAASMPNISSSGSPKSSPRTSKLSPVRCVSPLAASLLECLLEDSFKAMLNLQSRKSLHQSLLNETLALGEEVNSANGNATLEAPLSDNHSWEDESFDLNKIPVPSDLIPGLNVSDEGGITGQSDMAVVHSTATIEPITNENLNSRHSLSSSQSRAFLRNEEWVKAEVHSITEQLWNLVNANKPLTVTINCDQNVVSPMELQMKQMIADRCCEIAQQCFMNTSRSRFMGLANAISLRPRDMSHLEDILQKQLCKYYQTNGWDAKEKKRWEAVSRNCNSEIENIVLEDLYAEHEGWGYLVRDYEDKIKAELVAELWDEQLNESLSSITGGAKVLMETNHA